MGVESLEERAAELLGQIQASVSESVRAMNEAGALRRREVDEVHRQHDEAQKKLDAVRKSAEELLKRNEHLISEIKEGWRGRIAAVAVEAAAEQARQHGAAVVGAVETRARDLIRQLDLEIRRVADLNQSLRWKTLGYAFLIAVATLGVLVPLTVSIGGKKMAVEAERLARSQASGMAQLLMLQNAELRRCEVNGAARLCIRIDPVAISPDDKSGASFAVVHGY
jgi:FtsZ-binding cell division protein ZapB